jgi:hypothetical protein
MNGGLADQLCNTGQNARLMVAHIAKTADLGLWEAQ